MEAQLSVADANDATVHIHSECRGVLDRNVEPVRRWMVDELPRCWLHVTRVRDAILVNPVHAINAERMGNAGCDLPCVARVHRHVIATHDAATHGREA